MDSAVDEFMTLCRAGLDKTWVYPAENEVDVSGRNIEISLTTRSSVHKCEYSKNGYYYLTGEEEYQMSKDCSYGKKTGTQLGCSSYGVG